MEDRAINDLQELVASVETCTDKQLGLIYPVQYWLDHIKRCPEEFHLDRDYGLMWLGYQVWTGRSKDGKYLIAKYKEYSIK